MKKRFISVVAMIMLVGLLFTQAAYAAQPRVASPTLSLSFDGTTAVCSSLCKGDRTTDKLDVTISLYRGSTFLDSWSGSGTWKVALSGQHAAVSGQSYILELTWSINDVAQQPVSVTATCP